MRKLCTAILIVAAFSFCLTPASAANAKTVSVYARVLRTINPHLPDWQSRDLAAHVLSNASRWKVNANLLVALVTVESRWHTHARSRVGAIGLGQLMPGTAATLGVNPHNPNQNLSGAARYLGGLLSRYLNKPDRFQLACAAYNAGPKAVLRYGGIPPYLETQNYVVRVMSTWHQINSTLHIAHDTWHDGAALAMLDETSDTYWGATH
ncbi:MAG: lytic transglycosylase domain-containing protein [Candidatus Eremiobacteraeota bacterium]|nr:lytic transglycosylase domain-containing protein [Candidatus Eremiobacteraeota bacterium]